MCYSRACPHENYWGECTLPDPRKCPFGPSDDPEEEEEDDASSES